MESDPLDSMDLNHGVPPYFNKILDGLLDDSETIWQVRNQTVKFDPETAKKMEEANIEQMKREKEEEHDMLAFPKTEDPAAERQRASQEAPELNEERLAKRMS